MATEIYLYQYSKYPNSTDIPPVTGRLRYMCNLRSPTSITNPVVELEDLSDSTPIYRYNYAYIFSFGRYYFVTNVVSENNRWVFYLRVDVLASFNTSILNSSQYVLRSASEFDGSIIDTMYLTRGDTLHEMYLASKKLPNSQDEYMVEQFDPNTANPLVMTARSYFSVSNSAGCYVLGLLGTTTYGTVYYTMDRTFFREVLNNIFSLVPSNMTDVSSGVANALFNPIQYVVSCKWYPVMPLNHGPSVTRISVGSQSFTINTGTCYRVSSIDVEKFKMSLDVPSHPDKTASTAYLDLAPYRQVNLHTLLFGDIPLDSYKIFGRTQVHLTWDVDYTHGTTHMAVVTGNFDWNTNIIYPNTQAQVVYDMTCDTGVDVPVSSLAYDWKAGLALSGLEWLDNKFKDAPKGNFSVPNILNSLFGNNDEQVPASTDNTTVIGAVMDALGSSLGQVVSKNTSASFLSYTEVPYIYIWCMKQTENDLALYGRPLHQYKQLSTLSGFTVCSNAKISTFTETNKPYSSEREAICYLLNKGIFIESK